MKAVVRHLYGSPDVLHVNEVEKPQPKDHEILVKVYATTVNRTDCGILRARPFVIRFLTGLSKPKTQIPGTDFAGIVEAVGKNVTRFKAGDKIWGFDDNGSMKSQAEYLVTSEKKPIEFIPGDLSYEEAAACAEGAHYARNFINKVKLKPGQKALVNGATGAIGCAALQLLKYHGLYVTAVCNTKNVELIQSLGADRTIDYQKEDFTKDNEIYDFVFDAVGKSTFGKCKKLLDKKGIYISSELGPGSQNIFLALFTPLLGGKKVIFPFPSNIQGSLTLIKSLIEKGKFKPVIDRKYPIEKIREAYSYVESGQKTGNIIIGME